MSIKSKISAKSHNPLNLRSVFVALSSTLLFSLFQCTEDQVVRPEYLLGDEEAVVSFQDRQIDLRDHLEVFPFTNLFMPIHSGSIFYLAKNEKLTLCRTPAGSAPDLWRYIPISDVNFAGRNLWSMAYHDGRLYWLGDEKNDENINLWQLDTDNGQLKPLTDVPYIYGWGREQTGDQIAYVARHDRPGSQQGALRLLNLKTGQDRVLAYDSPEWAFSYGAPRWLPDGKGLIVNVLQYGHRSRGNLQYVDLETGAGKILLTQGPDRIFPSVHFRWLNETSFLYFSDEDGFRNAYRYDLVTGIQKQLTFFKADLRTPVVITLGDVQHLLASASTPLETRLFLLDLETGRIVREERTDLRFDLYYSQGRELIVGRSSSRRPVQIDQLKVSAEGFHFQPFLPVSEYRREASVKATVEPVRFPTFDNDPETGEQRLLHGYLYRPKVPLPPEQQLVVIDAFYGGANAFNTGYQVLADAGIYVFSPAIRGSNGFGRDFALLNDGDLGGDEIRDLSWAGRYISEKLNIPLERIGLFGSSHGGYAVLRAMTLPDTADRFEWGFGIARSGFSDLRHLYEEGNIRQWVLTEAGDPEREAGKFRERSPIHHIENLRSPLLLIHGERDARSPAGDIRAFAARAEEMGKQMELLELEGQGHFVKGLEAEAEMYRRWLLFLEALQPNTVKK